MDIKATILPGRGCGIVAARDLPAEHALLTVEGVGICAEADYQRHSCDHCFACTPHIDWLCSDPSMPVECKGCRSIRWCGDGCMTSARAEEHTAAECHAYDMIRWCKSAATQKRRRARQLARLFLLRQRDPQLFDTVLLLCTNRADWPQHEVEVLEEIAALTADSLPEGTVSWPAERDVMVDLLMAINCNQFALHSASEDAFATGVFVIPGLFNHSCDPSLRFGVSGTSMTLTTCRAVTAGEELCHSYLQTCEPELFEPASLDKRRQVLQDGYYFKCNCSLCTQQESAHTH